MTQRDTILTTSDLAVGYHDRKRDVTLLDGLNLQLRRGEMVALLGRNGAGKSTLLRALTLAEPPLKGIIMLDGHDARSLSQRQISRTIGLVTTSRQIMGELTVRELAALGRQPHTGLLGRLDNADNDIVDQALRDAGISHKADQNVSRLSDGERQKVMIAKALAQETPAIILDEPTAFLDVASRLETMALLHDLAHNRGKAILLSSHDIAQSLLLADRLWLITADGALLDGPTDELADSKHMNTLFNNPNIAFNPTLQDFTTVNC